MMLAAATFAILMITSTATLAADVAFDLKYGVLAGLTGDPAPDGQAWNEAARGSLSNRFRSRSTV
jgi:hypothetical protein